MKLNSYHVIPSGFRWSLRRTGGKRASAIYATREEAWKEARHRARAGNGTAYLHDDGGRIMARVRYESGIM